jgi:hypothetical protein
VRLAQDAMQDVHEFKEANKTIRPVVLSACKRENFAVTPILAEALGPRWAIQTAISQGVHSISFSSDALGVVNCVSGKSKVAAIDSVIHDCRTLLDSIPSLMVNYVSRELNKEAHVLAPMDKSLGSRTWLGFVPLNLAFSPAVTVPVSLVQEVPFV